MLLFKYAIFPWDMPHCQVSDYTLSFVWGIHRHRISMCAARGPRHGAHMHHTPGRAVRQSGLARAWGVWRGAMTQQSPRCQVSSWYIPHAFLTGDNQYSQSIYSCLQDENMGIRVTLIFCVTQGDDIPGRAPSPTP